MALTLLISLLVTASADADAGTPSPVARPVVLEVEDPLLQPAARPDRVIERFDQALTLLHQTSTDERSAEAAVQRAEGRWRQSLGAMLLNARLNATAAIDVANPSSPPLFGVGAGINATAPLVQGNLTVTQPLVDISAWRGLASSRAAQLSAEESLVDVRRRLTLGLARTLVAVMASERIAELNRLALRQALERAQLTQKSERLGAATVLDVVRVQQDVDVARGNLIAGDEQLRRSREALGLLLGAPGEVSVIAGFNLDALVLETQKRCVNTSWKDRADLASARANVESAEKSRAQASAGYLPTLGLSSQVQAMTLNDPSPGRALWSLSAVLTVPIWEGGTRGGIVQEREGIRTQAEQSLEQQRRQVQIEVARARRGVEVADALRKAAEQARDKAAQLDALTRRAFEVGRGNSLELVQTAAALRQADVALATREFEWVQARLDAFLTEARCDG